MLDASPSFGVSGVLDPLADFACHEVREQLVGLAIHRDVSEIAHPDAKTRLVVKRLPESLALFCRHLESAPRVNPMDEAAESFLASREDLGVVGPDPIHLLLADFGVVQGRAPLRSALEHAQMASSLGDFGDGLDAGRAGADHGDPFALKADRLLGPIM